MEALEYVQNLAFPVWVRESPSVFAFTAIVSLHAIGLAFVVGVHSARFGRLIMYNDTLLYALGL